MAPAEVASAQHPSLVTPFGQRAESAAHPLTAYLYRLMEAKSSNLCLSADVSTARALLLLADRVGPAIVVLKTHYDLVSGWDYHPQTGTGAQLAALARKHGFLLFEDRKFADIGKTVQQQYTAGTARIIDWAHMVTVNMDAGPAAVTALQDAADHWRGRVHYEVKTSVTVGTPLVSPLSTPVDGASEEGEGEKEEEEEREGGKEKEKGKDGATTIGSNSLRLQQQQPAHGSSLQGGFPGGLQGGLSGGGGERRKSSVVSITTVTKQSYEPMESPRLPQGGGEGGGAGAGAGAGATAGGEDSTARGKNSGHDHHHDHRSSSSAKNAAAGSSSSGGGGSGSGSGGGDYFSGLHEEAPLERGILLLAQMSSKGCLMTPAYTQACVEAARAHPRFVLGFIAQETLNTQEDDTFVILTPGCKLPPVEEEEEEEEEGGENDDAGKEKGGHAALAGDGMGQQYNTPAKLIGRGTDIVIVGRGIITAADPPSEAQRYRKKAWKAYQARLNLR